MITQGELRNQIEYDQDSGLWRWREPFASRVNAKKGWFAGSPMPQGYLQIRINGVLYYAHVLAWLYVYGVWPGRLDHKNRKKDENWIDNLRPATRSQNKINAELHINNTSGHKGVSYITGKWYSNITKDGERTWSSGFKTKEEAIAWRQKIEKKLFGEFAEDSKIVSLDRKQGC